MFQRMHYLKVDDDAENLRYGTRYKEKLLIWFLIARSDICNLYHFLTKITVTKSVDYWKLLIISEFLLQKYWQRLVEMFK